MGKRSDGKFERIPRDKYQTPFKAVPPLIPYLKRDGITRFAEPCCGDGNLVSYFEKYGLRCVYSGDIATGQDALDLTHAECRGAQVGISNPPFKHAGDPNPKSTKLMRALLWHYLDIGLPFWWLLPHDFSTNAYAPPFLELCSDIVVVGRIQWIPNSEYKNGFDNACWYRFDYRHRGVTTFHNDRCVRAKAIQLGLRLVSKAEAAE